ncbi:hypothetical protein PSN45_003305 [Yamadazyma tenuis]|nr:hypothetical protein PSN45_003305 [Yamadazyma tenuis]
MTNNTLFNLAKRVHYNDVKTLPHYGQRYGTSGIWVAKPTQRSKSDPMIIYSHGGGYFMQTQLEQMKTLIALYNSIDASKNVSLLFLDYDLVCRGHKFPRQLRQLDSIYQKLVDEGNTNLILFGDSAGAHLSISYTEYLKEEKPYLINPTKLVLISPWVDLMANLDDYKPGKSYYEGQNRDLINFKQFRREHEILFIDDEKKHLHPYFAWSNKQTVDWNTNKFFANEKSEVFLLYGEDESFRDHIHKWSQDVFGVKEIIWSNDSNNKLLPEFEVTSSKKGRAKLTCFVEPWGLHDALFFMEYDIIKRYKKDVDPERYFAFTRLVKYLNESL